MLRVPGNVVELGSFVIGSWGIMNGYKDSVMAERPTVVA